MTGETSEPTVSNEPRPSPDIIRDREKAVPVLLSFVSAFIDAICYLALFRTFTAFVTGTVLILATEIIHEDSELFTKVVVLATFMASLFGWTLVIRRVRSWRHLRSILFGCEAILLTCFLVAGVTLSPLRASDAPETTLLAVIAVLAMSLQTAIMALVLHMHVPTTVMTGNLMRFVISAIDIFGAGSIAASHDPEAAFKTRRQLLHYVYVLAAFIFGAVAGVMAYDGFGFYAVACPVAILIVLTLTTLGRR